MRLGDRDPREHDRCFQHYPSDPFPVVQLAAPRSLGPSVASLSGPRSLPPGGKSMLAWVAARQVGRNKALKMLPEQHPQAPSASRPGRCLVLGQITGAMLAQASILVKRLLRIAITNSVNHRKPDGLGRPQAKVSRAVQLSSASSGCKKSPPHERFMISFTASSIRRRRLRTIPMAALSSVIY